LPCRHLPDDDFNLALEIQQAEFREHLMRLTAAQEQQQGDVDVDNMTYEELQALGDTVGSVQVSFEN
jgi:hypothetical protein